ncbi:DUF5777 family beta-barrel protein [bacterium]|nr:DUF5777 family beta-barrel protein [bacterium]
MRTSDCLRRAVLTAALVSAGLSPLSLKAQQSVRPDSTGVEILEATEVTSLEPGRDYFSDNYARVERALSAPFARTLRRNSLLLVIDHRTRQSLDNNPFRDFLGLDAGGLKIGLGLRYGLLDNLECGLYRLNGVSEIFDVYEFDLKFAPLHQGKNGLDLALRSGLTWFAQPGIEDAAGGFFQVLADRTFLGRLTLGAGIMYHSESSNEAKNDQSTSWSVAAPLSAELRLNRLVALDLESVTPLGGYRSRNPLFNAGVKIITNRHTFALLVGNGRYLSADGLVCGTPRRLGDAIIGFTIIREFDL